MSIPDRPHTTVAVGGFSSNAGKTTLMCELLRAFPGWEAIKVTRGHYRSCGKDPHACCVSHLLGADFTLRSGRAETYGAGKDTGRYWDAGAANVHWLIVTDEQVERGINAALAKVEAAGVFVEGNSFLKYVEADFVLMAARALPGQKLKPSARRALARTSALYLFDEHDRAVGGADGLAERERFKAWSEQSGDVELLRGMPLYTRADFPELITRVEKIHAAQTDSSSRTGQHQRGSSL